MFDTDDYEYQQLLSEGHFGTSESAATSNVADEVALYEKAVNTNWKFQNWHPEDLQMYVGGEYTKYEHYKQRYMMGAA